MDSQTQGTGLQYEVEEEPLAENGQSYLTEGFDKILSLRELQPDPVTFFGPPQKLLESNHESPEDNHQPSSLDTFRCGCVNAMSISWGKGCGSRWNAERHQRSLGRGDIVLLFDLNGTLTSHTARRRSTGANKLRPGIEHLLRLKVSVDCRRSQSDSISRIVFDWGSSVLRHIPQ